MSVLEENRPSLSRAEAEELARARYRIDGVAHPLPSERDQNFHMVTAEGSSFVLKVSSKAEQREILEFQNAVLAHLGENLGFYRFPTAVPDVGGSLIGEVGSGTGSVHYVRMLTYLPGSLLAQVKPHTRELLHALGRFMAGIDLALQTFPLPVPERELHWDIDAAYDIISTNKGIIPEPERRELIEHFLQLYVEVCLPRLDACRTSIIHNDANDHNVIVTPDSTVAGIIDFGDMVHSYTVQELAVAMAYAMLGKADPLSAGAAVVSGYHEALPLKEVELELLYTLLSMRLCLSVTLSAERRRQAPIRDYLAISERPAWRLLSQLAEIGPEFAHYTFRHACQLIPCPSSIAVVKWLEKSGHLAKPILPLDLESSLVLDLSVGTELFDGPEPLLDVGQLSRLVFRKIRDAGAEVGIGRYDEARLLYQGEGFRIPGEDGGEQRTVHLGLDLFAPAGTAVVAPLDGVVHSFADNAQPLDYGPTIILRHQTDTGEFYTLYGHMSRDSLEELTHGKAISAGTTIAAVGEPLENGGWPPHLHFQIIVDMLGKDGDFPGVAAPSQREVWLSICPDPNLILRLHSAHLKEDRLSPHQILAERNQRLPPSLSVAYRRPLNIVRGWRQYLYDEAGQRYLDAVNNVAHVGHCHPRVVLALRQQAAVLNTNTRYLHQKIVDYAKRLCETLPEPLRACFFVCSGSEANELALRLARTHTGRRDVIVVDGAYHGNTGSLIDVSPYKFDGPGGFGAPEHVHKVPMPDGYRGAHRADEAGDLGLSYARYVGQAIETAKQSGRRIATFICESALGCGGQIILPSGYLSEAFRAVREDGGVCIADEVQVGFGRFGSHFWAFEEQGVVPDIVTLGKPMGNGHPLAAVVTTAEIAASFANGMEYFNTFGGNPVSCAVGLAVLDVIDEEQLQARALQVGERLTTGLRQLMLRHRLIGDVRGRGLFVGIELVSNRKSREPAGAAAAYVVERLRDFRILMSTDGPDHNVLKIKPPLVFTEEDADLIVSTLHRILEEDVPQS